MEQSHFCSLLLKEHRLIRQDIEKFLRSLIWGRLLWRISNKIILINSNKKWWLFQSKMSTMQWEDLFHPGYSLLWMTKISSNNLRLDSLVRLQLILIYLKEKNLWQPLEEDLFRRINPSETLKVASLLSFRKWTIRWIKYHNSKCKQLKALRMILSSTVRKNLQLLSSVNLSFRQSL